MGSQFRGANPLPFLPTQPDFSLLIFAQMAEREAQARARVEWQRSISDGADVLIAEQIV
jgi:hypothetical protein